MSRSSDPSYEVSERYLRKLNGREYSERAGVDSAEKHALPSQLPSLR